VQQLASPSNKLRIACAVGNQTAQLSELLSVQMWHDSSQADFCAANSVACASSSIDDDDSVDSLEEDTRRKRDGSWNRDSTSTCATRKGVEQRSRAFWSEVQQLQTSAQVVAPMLRTVERMTVDRKLLYIRSVSSWLETMAVSCATGLPVRTVQEEDVLSIRNLRKRVGDLQVAHAHVSADAPAKAARVLALVTEGLHDGLRAISACPNADRYPDPEREAGFLDAWFLEFADTMSSEVPARQSDLQRELKRQIHTVLQAYYAMRAAVDPKTPYRVTRFSDAQDWRLPPLDEFSARAVTAEMSASPRDPTSDDEISGSGVDAHAVFAKRAEEARVTNFAPVAFTVFLVVMLAIWAAYFRNIAHTAVS